MKRISALVSTFVFGAALFGASACSMGAGSGCGPTEAELDEQATNVTNRTVVTCGPGTHLEGNTCVRNTP